MKNIIKKIALVGMIGVMAFGTMACGDKKSQGTQSTLDKDKLVIGIDVTFAPMGFKDTNGEIVGFDIDLAKEVGKKLNKEVTFQTINWTKKEIELKNEGIDLIWNGYTITDKRKEQVDFSIPYLANKQVVITMADSNIKTKADLAGKVVGAQDQSSAVDAIEGEEGYPDAFKDGKIITYEYNNEALIDLEVGRLDAVVADEVILRYYINKKGAEKYNIISEDFGDELYGVGIRKGDTKMVEAFNKAFKELIDDGKAAEISKKWFGEDIIYKEK